MTNVVASTECEYQMLSSLFHCENSYASLLLIFPYLFFLAINFVAYAPITLLSRQKKKKKISMTFSVYWMFIADRIDISLRNFRKLFCGTDFFFFTFLFPWTSCAKFESLQVRHAWMMNKRAIERTPRCWKTKTSLLTLEIWPQSVILLRRY